jgi:hypothetical protein
MVICDVIIVMLWGRHEPHLYKTTNVIEKFRVCSDCSTDRPLPRVSLSLGLPIPWDNSIEIRPSNNSAMASWKEESINSAEFIVALF